MTKEELLEFLKENLSISIDREYGFYSDDGIKVVLSLDCEEISSSTVYLSELSR